MLKFIKPKNKEGKLKLTFQKSGKLGFSAPCNQEFDLENNRFASFAVDDYENVFIKVSNKKEVDSFLIAKAGLYYYTNIRANISDFNLKLGDSVIFDLTSNKDGFYKMEKRFYTPRINKRNNKIKQITFVSTY